MCSVCMLTPTPVDIEIAARIPVLSGLKPDEMAVLLAEASILNLRPRRALFRQGDAADAFFIIMEGWIKLYRVTAAGNEAVLNVLGRGESFAEAVTFTSGHYPATARAATAARVMVIPAGHVLSCIRGMPEVAIAMIASTSQHLHRLAQQIERLMARSALQRVAEFLASLAPSTTGPCTIKLPYDKSLIAGRLGLKPESLSRVFAKLRSAGVDVRASNVVVRDMAELCRLVDCDCSAAPCPITPRLTCRDRPAAIQPAAKPA